MDDLATSFPSTEQALEEKQNINTILQSGKFAVKGWHSNFSQVDEFPEAIETEILGHRWNKSTDNFRPNFVETVEKTITKRSILSTVSKLWDPTGIFAPLTLQVRLLLQSLWQLRVSWDEQLPDSVCITFMKAMKAIMDLQEYRIPRRLLSDFHKNPVELHGFCDGGELAYGAVIWLRYQTEQDFKLKILT